jgi:Ca2+-binding EF-hand superfamily protein
MGLRADKADLKELKISFEQMDVDKDGSLSYQEIMGAEKQLKTKLGGKWKEVMKQCDLDGDGKIDFHEFFTAAVNH